MASASEGKYAGEFLAASIEGASALTNDAVVILSGQSLVPGDVVGKVTISGVGRVSIPAVVGTGNGTTSLVTAGPLTQVGSYVLTCTTAVADGGVFTLVAPDGTTVGVYTLTVGAGGTSAFKSPHLNFSITDGSTNFAAADAFTYVVGTTVPTVIGGTGTGVISAITAGSRTQRGNYRIINREVLANGGRFEVIAPNGATVGYFVWSASSSTASFTSDHLNFTLSDATDYIAGNYFDVAVYGIAAAKPKVVKWDPTAVDGRQTVAGIAWDTYDASAADVNGVIVARGPVAVNGAELSWISTAGVADKVFGKAALTALGIVVR
jgi:hypothetical protein